MRPNNGVTIALLMIMAMLAQAVPAVASDGGTCSDCAAIMLADQDSIPAFSSLIAGQADAQLTKSIERECSMTGCSAWQGNGYGRVCINPITTCSCQKCERACRSVRQCSARDKWGACTAHAGAPITVCDPPSCGPAYTCS